MIVFADVRAVVIFLLSVSMTRAEIHQMHCWAQQA
jgi:hypothetical protein